MAFIVIVGFAPPPVFFLHPKPLPITTDTRMCASSNNNAFNQQEKMAPERGVIRRAITNELRLRLRQAAREHPEWNQGKLAAWAESQFGRKFSQSTISETLGARYAHLEAGPSPLFPASSKKIRHAQHPLLEEALNELLLLHKRSGVSISGDLIMQSGRQLWSLMRDFDNKEMPSFSRGWLDGFKSRFSLKRYQMSADARPVEFDDPVAELNHLQDLVKLYDSKDVYCMDETALHWRKSLNFTLATQSQQVPRKDKDRVTLVPCTNATGSHQLDLWIVGKTKNPCGPGRRSATVVNLPVHWRGNGNAWMTSKIFYDWLLWFDGQMNNRKVLLLMDRSVAHEAAVEDAKNHAALRNTRIGWLPRTSTAALQPVNLGISNNFKAIYKSIWLQFMLDIVYENRDPMAEVTPLHVVNWCADAWREVKDSTISYSFKKSKLFDTPPGTNRPPKQIEEARSALRTLLRQSRTTRIRDLVALDRILITDENFEDFIEPSEEQISDPLDDFASFVASTFTQVSHESELDEIAAELQANNAPAQKLSDAIDAYATIYTYEASRDEVDFGVTQVLERRLRQLRKEWASQRDESEQWANLDSEFALG